MQNRFSWVTVVFILFLAIMAGLGWGLALDMLRSESEPVTYTVPQLTCCCSAGAEAEGVVEITPTSTLVPTQVVCELTPTVQPTWVGPSPTSPSPEPTDPPDPTATPEPEPTNTPPPTNTPVPEPTDPPPEPTDKPKCNKGEGNGGEGCDPGNNPEKGNDDED